MIPDFFHALFGSVSTKNQREMRVCIDWKLYEGTEAYRDFVQGALQCSSAITSEKYESLLIYRLKRVIAGDEFPSEELDQLVHNATHYKIRYPFELMADYNRLKLDGVKAPEAPRPEIELPVFPDLKGRVRKDQPADELSIEAYRLIQVIKFAFYDNRRAFPRDREKHVAAAKEELKALIESRPREEAPIIAEWCEQYLSK